MQFISNLLPLYVGELVNGVSCARNLSDGTLIVPANELPEDETGFVTVHWQGDPNRQTVVQGVFITSLAVAKYAKLHHLAQGAKGVREEIERLSQHFTVKTGETLAFEHPDSELWELVQKAVGKAGEAGVMEFIKKSFGF
ncbi:hypothetical protein [Acidovorax carolinensis]|uniref:hypothetical protein n=1 Tax=Acidovorax carolinensis TaxID=553814 RepID=UPI000B345285|nr:hypothetical protein [Acidovorax carolinensis]ART46977.1 hypothetical protein CBP33_01560 [Acidovorax carolinensis]